jgi:hypothetical protein
MNMLPALIFVASFVWFVSVLVAISLCAVARRSDDAAGLMARDTRLN